MIVEDRDLWWDPKRPRQGSLFESRIKLSPKFFEEIVAHPVPIDLKVLSAMHRSSLGIDLYLWAAYRSKHIRTPKKIPWSRLYEQFGGSKSGTPGATAVMNFRVEALRELEKLRVAWPELDYELVRGALILNPSVSRIPPVNRSDG